MKNYAFIHYCLLPMWEIVVLPQTERLVSSPAYKILDKIFYSLTNSAQEDLSWIPDKGEIIFQDQAIRSELTTLESLRRFSLDHPHDKILYLHGKGVSQLSRDDVRPHTKDCIRAWREYMEYFMLEEYEACFKALDGDKDICGVEYRTFPDFHFSGNFWWANNSYLKTLPPIESLAPDRRLAEFWPCYGPSRKKCLYNFGVDLYHFKAELKSYGRYKKRHWKKTKRGLDVV